MALLVDAWLRLRPAMSGRAVPRLTWLVWSLPVLAAPPLFSRDAYSYAAQGNLVAKGIDPYVYGPIEYPGAFANQVDPMWLDTPAPYGPLALQVQRLVVELTGGDHAYLAAIAMRIPALLAVGLLAYALPRLAARYGVSPDHARWLGVLNPLVMMHFVGGAHGDAIMVALVVTGLLLASRGQFAFAAMTVSVGACFKQTAVLGLIGVVGAMAHAGGLPPRPVARAATLARHSMRTLAVAGVTFVAVTTATGLGWGWIHTLSVPTVLRSLLAPPTLVGSGVELLLRLSGMPLTTIEAAVPTAQAIGMAVGLGALVWVAWRLAPRAPMRAAAAAFLVLCASGPVVHPWYLLWGGVLLAAVRLSPRAIRTTVVLTLFLVTYGVVDATLANGTWALGVSVAIWIATRLRAHRHDHRSGTQLHLMPAERGAAAQFATASRII
jgi:hypothetical protein